MRRPIMGIHDRGEPRCTDRPLPIPDALEGQIDEAARRVALTGACSFWEARCVISRLARDVEAEVDEERGQRLEEAIRKVVEHVDAARTAPPHPR